MWRDRILGWTAEVSFHDGASESTLRACEAAFGQDLHNRTMVAPGLAAYLEWWLDDSLTV